MPDTIHEASETGADAQRRLVTTVDLVSAYVSNNSIRSADLGPLIETIYGTLGQLVGEPAPVKEEAPLVPAVPIKKSITQDFLICLEDGKKFRSLKRHIGTVYNLSPDQYRAKWGLPRDYPMVAPAYSEVRSKLAKDIGLGRPAELEAKIAAKAASAATAETLSEPAAPKKAPRARKPAKATA